MQPVLANYHRLLTQIREAELKYHRTPHSVQCLVVGKTFPADRLIPLIQAGHRDFGESYVQEALPKIDQIANPNLVWHFIGRIQTNKCQHIAEHFGWVHSLYRLKEAEKLNDFREASQNPLQICIQVKLDGSQTKRGIAPEDVINLAQDLRRFPKLTLRGLMALPPPTADFQEQRSYFKAVKEIGDHLAERGFNIDTLSMGMTEDFEAAIAEGSTIVRIGRALFGSRR